MVKDTVMWGVGGLEPISASTDDGTPWTSRLFIAGLPQRDKQPSTLTFTFFGTLKEAGEPRENPCRHRENMSKLHTETPCTTYRNFVKHFEQIVPHLKTENEKI